MEGITRSTYLSLNILVSLEEASGSVKLRAFYSPLPRCPFSGCCSIPQKVSSLFMWVSALLICPFVFVLSAFDVLSKTLRNSLNDSQSFSQHDLGIWKTISFPPLPSVTKTFFVSRHYAFYFSFLFQRKDFTKCVLVSNESTQHSSINYLTVIREWNLPSVYTLLIFKINVCGKFNMFLLHLLIWWYVFSVQLGKLSNIYKC